MDKSPFNADEFKNLINKDVKSNIPQDQFPDVDSSEASKIKMVSIHDVKDTEFEDIPNVEELTQKVTSMPSIPQDLMKVNPSVKIVNSAKDSYNKLFDELNHKYGFSIRFDGDSFKDSFIQIIDGRSKKAMDLFLSESYSRFKSVTMLMYLQAISSLSAQVLNPAFLQSESLSYQDRFDILDRLYNFIDKVTKLSESIEIPDSEMKLEKLVDEGHTGLDTQDENVRNFLDLLSQSIMNKNNDNKDNK